MSLSPTFPHGTPRARRRSRSFAATSRSPALQLEYSLAQRSVEHEFVPLGSEHGMGIMAWAPLANGLLSGKYRAGQDSDASASRLEVLKGFQSPGPDDLLGAQSRHRGRA